MSNSEVQRCFISNTDLRDWNVLCQLGLVNFTSPQPANA
jgi:hypothetical protein